MELIIFLLCLIPFSYGTDFDICKDVPPPLSLRVSTCEKAPCNLVKNTNVTVELDFEVGKDVSFIQTKVVAVALGAVVPYKLNDSDVCHSLTNGECPLMKGEVVTYRLIMFIQPAFPKVSGVHITFSLVEAINNQPIGETITCFSITCNVVDS